MNKIGPPSKKRVTFRGSDTKGLQANEHSRELQALDRTVRQLIGANALEPKGRTSWPPTPDLLNRFDFHGVAGLVYSAHRNRHILPTDLANELRKKVVASMVWEENHAQLVSQVLSIFQEKQIPLLLFKGTALAYGHYQAPHLRDRGDTDIIVPPEHRETARRILSDLQFVSPLQAGEKVTIGASAFYSRDPSGTTHEMDLHWQINNSTFLSQLFSFEELFGRAMALPKLHPYARTLGSVDALLVACFHRLVHVNSPYWVGDTSFFGGNRLIWLYDIHLLANAMTEFDWALFLELAKKKGLLEICGAGLKAAKDAFSTNVTDHIAQELKPQSPREIPAVYVSSRRYKQLMMNFGAQVGLQNKMAFLRELFFPHPDYMRMHFQNVRFQWLPWMYCVRGLGGLKKIFGNHAGVS